MADFSDNDSPSAPVVISVIVPTWNEEDRIDLLLERLQTIRGVTGIPIEIIVCDGGSQDSTREKALRSGARVIQTARCRGAQLNAGARLAGGDVFWFVHADALPHTESVSWIARAMRRRRAIGGNFRLRFDAQGFAPRLFESIARVQRRWGVYYGDSGPFVRREAFEALGGYQEWPLFEDYDFARRLERYARRRGELTLCAQLPLVASSRRFRKRPLRMLLRWATLQLLFSLGVSSQRLARLYYGHGTKQ